MFNGKYTDSDYTKKLKKDAKPYHAKLFPVPKCTQTNSQVNGLIKIGVLKKNT